MNASDIIKVKQNRTLYQAYYRPEIFSSPIVSTVTYCPISSISTASGFISSVTSSITTNYLYKCNPPIISYELANSINTGRYECGFPYCSTLTEWNTGNQFITGNCDCKISFLTWKNTNPTTIYNYTSTSLSTFTVTSTSILTGPGPVICQSPEFYQGINYNSRCNSCGGNNGCPSCS
jgi:hypothetical protein